jgi:hypothetical protein
LGRQTLQRPAGVREELYGFRQHHHRQFFVSDNPTGDYSCTPNPVSPLHCTTNPANVVGVSFSLDVRHFSCTNCTTAAFVTSPELSLASQIVMENVALDAGFGSVSY